MIPIVFRTDATERMGHGHLMRSLALACEWRDRGGRPLFVMTEESSVAAARIAEEDIAVRFIKASAETREDADAVGDVADEIGARWVIIDGYEFSTAFHEAIHNRNCRVFVIDDNGQLDASFADVVLNQNLHASADLYRNVSPRAQLLVGTDYVLLRPEFRRIQRSLRPRPLASPPRVLVTCGGSDSAAITEKAIAALQQLGRSLDVKVVVGSSNSRAREIARAAQNFEVITAARNMPELMQWADLAITTAGSTVWELAFLGIPMIALAAADNQRPVAESLAQRGAAISLGWHENAPASSIQRAVDTLLVDESARKRLSACASGLVGGNGVKRVADVVMDAGEKPRLRDATATDVRELWLLANDSLVRKNSFDRPRIAYADHREWYRTALADPAIRIFVYATTHQVAAVIRYHLVECDVAEVHFSVGAESRGKGLGTRALRETWWLACEQLGASAVRGVVLEDNVASARAFRSAGFQQTGELDERGFHCLVFQKVYARTEATLTS